MSIPREIIATHVTLTVDEMEGCHVTDGPPKISPLRPSMAIFLAVGGLSDHVWLLQIFLQTIYGAISGPLYHRCPLMQQPFRQSLTSVVEGPRNSLYLRHVKGKISFRS